MYEEVVEEYFDNVIKGVRKNLHVAHDPACAEACRRALILLGDAYGASLASLVRNDLMGGIPVEPLQCK